MGQLRNRMEQDLILRRLSPATRRNSPTVKIEQFRHPHLGV
jgi:hypothetical protein